MSQTAQTATPQDAEPIFSIQRIYLKDASFETPHSPHIFRSEWQPRVDIELQTGSTLLEEGVYEVVIGITATAVVGDKVAFLAEVKQAGIFTVSQFPEDQMGPMLGIVCPNILFPYAREAISNSVVRGSFPQLNIDPVNFEALYMQQDEQKSRDETTTH